MGKGAYRRCSISCFSFASSIFPPSSTASMPSPSISSSSSSSSSSAPSAFTFDAPVVLPALPPRILAPVILLSSPSFLLRLFPPIPFAIDDGPATELSTEGEREYRSGEPTISDSGAKELRRLDGLRFLEVEPVVEIEGRLRGMLRLGIWGGDAMIACKLGEELQNVEEIVWL